ncbi:MAG TPA: hypothetical protein VIC57_05820 [Candidatus Dormibacteraeota bacterium]
MQDPSPRAPSAEERRSLDEQLEVERDRRRRVVAALVSGADARPATTPPGPWGPLIAGLTIAAFIVLIVGVATLIRSSIPGSRPAAHPSPTVTATTR